VRLLPFYEGYELPTRRTLTDTGAEYCGKPEKQDYQLYLPINDMEHYKVAFWKTINADLAQLQHDLDK
jgi:hypothetical protein